MISYSSSSMFPLKYVVIKFPIMLKKSLLLRARLCSIPHRSHHPKLPQSPLPRSGVRAISNLNYITDPSNIYGPSISKDNRKKYLKGLTQMKSDGSYAISMHPKLNETDRKLLTYAEGVLSDKDARESDHEWARETLKRVNGRIEGRIEKEEEWATEPYVESSAPKTERVSTDPSIPPAHLNAADQTMWRTAHSALSAPNARDSDREWAQETLNRLREKKESGLF
eukprot:189541_1